MRPNPPDYDPDAPQDMTLDPIPVRIVGTDNDRDAVIEQGVWMYYTFAATDGPQQILPQNSKRKRAVVTVQPGAAGNVVGFVYVGDMGHVSNRAGGRLYVGNTTTVESKPAVFAMSDGTNSLSVTVLDESYL
jgi:hypothetical protein